MYRLLALFALLAALAPRPASAVNPDEVLQNPVMELRAREISKELRCVVCQNQSIDDSDAELARDLRVLVRERIKAGDADDQVIEYVVSRYGDFVLLRPPVKGATFLLWAGPGILAAIGVISIVLFFRRRQTLPQEKASRPPLNATEQQRINDLLDEK